MAIQPLNTIKKWFQTGLKPSQNEFWDTWDSFRHQYEKIPVKDVENLETILDAKAEKLDLDQHRSSPNAHDELFITKEDKKEKGAANGYVPLDEFKKIANQYLTIIDNLVTGGSESILSAQQGVVLQNQIDSINTLLTSNNINLDTIQEIVDTIENIQGSLSTLFVNDLITGGATKALTAEMGKFLESSKENKSQKGIAGGYAPLNDFTKLASQYLDIVNDLVSGGSSSLLSAEQGKVLQNQINGINTLLDSDNINLDTIQEIVNVIEEVQLSLNTILINDLTTGGVTKALTAEMGKLLESTKLTATIATDEETQITYTVTEDSKVISRSKLFNWWKWIENTVLHTTGNETFTGIKTSTNTGTTQINGLSLVNNGTNTSQVISITNNNTGAGSLISNNGYGTGAAILNNSSGTGLFSNNNSTGTSFIINSMQASTGDLFQFKKNNSITSKVDQNGVITTPSLIIPNGNLKSSVNGTIERDIDGQLWETHNGIRSRLVTTADGLILLAYKSLNGIQTWLDVYSVDTNISTVVQNSSSNTVIGKISNGAFMNLNLTNEIIYRQYNGVSPIVAKIEVFLKINNGLFTTDYLGTNPVDQVKIIEYSGTNIAGIKSYKNALYTVCQNNDPLLSQWANINLILQTVNNGITTETSKTYNLRDTTNSRTFGAGEASFSFVFRNTLVYEDATNSAGQNGNTMLVNNNYALYIETIR